MGYFSNKGIFGSRWWIQVFSADFHAVVKRLFEQLYQVEQWYDCPSIKEIIMKDMKDLKGTKPQSVKHLYISWHVFHMSQI